MKQILVIILIGVLLASLISFVGALVLWAVYRAIAEAFNLPELSYWVFYGIVFVINLFSVRVNNKTE